MQPWQSRMITRIPAVALQELYLDILIMEEVTRCEMSTFAALLAAGIAHLSWIIKKNPGWREDKFITATVFVTVLLFASLVSGNQTLGNITHTLYGALLLLAVAQVQNKDVLIFCISVAAMTVMVNKLFKRCSWAAIFNYSTDYKNESKIIIRDTTILTIVLIAKYFYVHRSKRMVLF
jgi:cell division protein FtsW (lipid II flippase)